MPGIPRQHCFVATTRHFTYSRHDPPRLYLVILHKKKEPPKTWRADNELSIVRVRSLRIHEDIDERIILAALSLIFNGSWSHRRVTIVATPATAAAAGRLFESLKLIIPSLMDGGSVAVVEGRWPKKPPE